MGKTFLHVGCGRARKDNTTADFAGSDWKEVRLDINPAVLPDMVGNITDMSEVETGSFDAVYSSDNIEHLYPFEVPLALREFVRVLKPEGFAIIKCPDLQSVAALIADDKLTDAAYESPSGPIAPIDILFGHRPSLAAGNLAMAHRCGFTKKVLSGAMIGSGFSRTITMQRRAPFFELWAVGTKIAMEEAELRELAQLHFPR